ncbi:MAG TPA: hypothetical protein VI032_07930 [Burkholderiaceae bacterium]
MHLTNNHPTTPRSRVRTPIHELALVAIIEDDGKPASDESFSRCGWFDSSLDLAAGLLVTEFIDDLPAGLPFEAVQ